MKSLTVKEEEIMNHFWTYGDMQIRELQSHYSEPKPHVNTLSTLVKILEEKGFLDHRALTARCFQYFATISREEYSEGSLTNVVNKFFGRSYLNAVSALVREEKLSVDDLRQLIREVEEG
ncbi:MAG: BlaI/MecI/CopY family transcriptional regulator [Prevotella sp.]